MPLYADQIRRQRLAQNDDIERIQDEINALLEKERQLKSQRMLLMRKMRELRKATRRSYERKAK
jgi:hypothetical protein